MEEDIWAAGWLHLNTEDSFHHKLKNVMSTGKIRIGADFPAQSKDMHK